MKHLEHAMKMLPHLEHKSLGADLEGDTVTKTHTMRRWCCRCETRRAMIDRQLCAACAKGDDSASTSD